MIETLKPLPKVVKNLEKRSRAQLKLQGLHRGRLCGLQNLVDDQHLLWSQVHHLGLVEKLSQLTKQKKDARDKIKAARKIVHAEVLDTPTGDNSTLVNQVANGTYIRFAMDNDCAGDFGFHLGGDDHCADQDHARHAPQD